MPGEWRMLLIAAAVVTVPRAVEAAGEVLAEAPNEVSVTVYRAPSRESGSMNLNGLEGFALVSETRSLRLAAGASRVRFEGVADGIEPASAIVTGLPAGIIEKNRDARLLSPSALVAAAAGKPVVLLRTSRKTGRTERVSGKILSDADGVIFDTPQGIEALRCSGLSEGFSFQAVSDLTATPTLSMQVRTAEAISVSVTLSYLARGFDWAADYSATLSADGKTMDLGAWVTLANGNGVGFPSAHAQVVAGRVNRESAEVEPIDLGAPILARCWPRGSTSDPAQLLQIDRAAPFGTEYLKSRRGDVMHIAAPAALMESAVARLRVEQEQLGDLKLYRVPERTTVASRQSKQVRLLDRTHIPIRRVYSADLVAWENAGPIPAILGLRTVNNTASHLGLPLPSGHIAVFATRQTETLLLHESDVRDLTVDEDVEINMGPSYDVEVNPMKEATTIDPSRAQLLPLVPGVMLMRTEEVDDINRVEVTNARATAIQFELRLQLREGARVVRTDHPLGAKNGRPIFRFPVAAHGSEIVRYQTNRRIGGPVRK